MSDGSKSKDLTSKVRTHAGLSVEFICALTKRLESFLPNVTGYSLTEVELNPQFSITKNLLIDNVKKDPEYTSLVIYNLCKVLNSINKDSNDLKLRDRDEKVLASNLVILKIITDLVQKVWKGLVVNLNSTSFYYFNNFEILSNFTFYYHFDAPKSLNPKHVDYILETLVDLLSNDIIRYALAAIQKRPIDQNKYYKNSNPVLSQVVTSSSNPGTPNTSSPAKSPVGATIPKSAVTASGGLLPLSPSSNTVNSANLSSTANSHEHSSGTPTSNTFNLAQKYDDSIDSSSASVHNTVVSQSQNAQSEMDITRMVNEIDLHIEICLRFVSTSTSNRYYDFLSDKLFRFSNANENLPLFVLQKYSPLIKYQFYSEYNGILMARAVNKCLENMKNSTWKQILLLFYAQSVRDQALARPEDYDFIVQQSGEVAMICKGIFDQTNNIFEEVPFSGVTSMVQSWISILIPSDYKEFELKPKPNKLKLNFNKRLKFINNLLKDSNNKSNLTCFDSLITLFYLAGRFPKSMFNHPVYTFTMNYLDSTFDNLMTINLANFTTNLNSSGGEHIKVSYDNLIVNFFSAAIMLKPKMYTEKLIQKFLSTKDSFRDIRIIVKIIKRLSENSMTEEDFKAVVLQLAAPLKLLTFNAAKLLSHCYDTSIGSHPFSTSSSSSVSVHSDKVSVYSSKVNRRLSFDNELSPSSSRLLNVHQTQQTNPPEINFEELKFTSASFSSNKSNTKTMNNLEDMLSDLFTIFKSLPSYFFNDLTYMNIETFSKDEDGTRLKINKFVKDTINMLKVGLQSRSVNDESSVLFNSTCSLIMTIVDRNSCVFKRYNEVTVYTNYITCKQIIKAICDSCLTLSLKDVKLKSSLLFLNQFLEKRDSFNDIVSQNRIVDNAKSHIDENSIGNSLERILLLSMCTHDIQFYNIVKETMRWHLLQLARIDSFFTDNLRETFEQIVKDESVFTGFVSLHKRFRSILRSAKPTKALYQVWLIICERWYDLLYSKQSLNEENLLFRHFTGFLVSTSGCFLSESFASDNPDLRQKSEQYMSSFFDKCIELLTSQDLVVRVIIKDALSNESHSAVYHLISKKLTSVITNLEENRNLDDESILFTEQAIMIVTAMINIPNDGSVVLTAMLPEICATLMQLINMVEDATHQLRLKLRFCKLTITIEENRERLLLAGAYKLRNVFAKSICDWLEQSVFHDELPGNNSFNKPTNTNRNKESELVYINIDLATESSKALSLQLEELILEIPEGTLEKDIPKYKDLAFANYFSLFYKILTKYTINATTHTKSKFKIQAIVDNVLRCITNLLQFDTDIGLQFVFPLGYHDNKKIRALFLSVFADMLYERKLIREKRHEYNDEVMQLFTEVVDIVPAASVVATNNNHHVYASALFGVYGYLDSLDKVFDVLLIEEINNVSRTSDIFRRNSILTKLLAKLAKDYGLEYLTLVLKDFTEEFTTKQIVFNVEREQDENSNPDLFMAYLNKLVDLIVDSADLMPLSFRYICSEIYKRVCEKVPDSGLIAVGSFIFLRFFCPAIISPETFFDIDVISHQNKKSLLQLVKVLQNMANKTLSVLKWKSLNNKMEELDIINAKIFKFLQTVSSCEINEYPFKPIKEVPIPELRYSHKFLFTFYKEIKQFYLLGDISPDVLGKKVVVMRLVDKLMKQIGQPKNLLEIHGADTSGYKSFDPAATISSEYTDFMNRMSAVYAEKVMEVSLIHNSIFYDGTPVVVVNLFALKLVDFDVKLLVYKLFETASQVWDNKFYFVFDFTGFSSEMHLLVSYSTLLNTYAPPQVFKNCTRIYYFNLPIKDISAFFSIVKPSNVQDKESRAKFYTYSHCDSTDTIASLCLSEETMAITRDKKVEFTNCKVLNGRTQAFFPATIRIGRQFLLICSDEFVATNHELCATNGFRPVEIFRLSDINRCEITKNSGANDEFTIYFNDEHSVIIRSHERSEVLRFLYFTTSRLPKPFIDDDDKNFHSNDISNLWFGRLFNIVFQSLLCENDEVRSSASLLLASVANYFEVDYTISKKHAKVIAYPANITDFIVSISTHLSKKFPHMSYRFLRAFFDCYEKLPAKHRMDAILYISPWVSNICDNIYLKDEHLGPDRVAGLIRHFCSISAYNKDTIAATNDFIWKRLFSESILTSLLLDEIVNFVMDNRNDDPDWAFIISVITPSVELCGETIKRLLRCINEANNNDSEIASESKLFEISILVKICASLFFDSYIYAQLFLADIFFICTLFIDNPSLDFGADLQKLVINTIQSFFNKPDLTDAGRDTVESTLSYFSGQRAKMLFGLTREKTSASSDISQLYNRAGSFEILCDYLNDFIKIIGSADDRAGWRSRWSSYAMDVAFSNGSLFQMRAILVVGILSKTGVSDHTTAKMLKLMSRNSLNNSMEYMTNILMSAARIFQGLSKDSVFPSIIIWPEIYFGMLNYSSLYQASIQCLLNTLLKNFEQGPGFAKRMFQRRKYLSSFVDSFEKSHGFHIDEKNILCYIFFIFTQGLKLSHIKHTSLHCLKTIFTKRFEIEPASEFEVPSGILPYLFFVWLSCNESNFEEFIDSTSYTPSEYSRIGSSTIPKVLIDYLLSDDLYPVLTLYQAAFTYITPTVENGFKTRFLYVLDEVMTHKAQKGRMVFHIVKNELETSMVNSNSTEVVSVVSNIILKIMHDASYDAEEQEKETKDFLADNGLSIISYYKFRKLSELINDEEGARERIDADNERLQEMIYRSASSYVENEKLEN